MVTLHWSNHIEVVHGEMLASWNMYRSTDGPPLQEPWFGLVSSRALVSTVVASEIPGQMTTTWPLGCDFGTEAQNLRCCMHCMPYSLFSMTLHLLSL